MERHVKILGWLWIAYSALTVVVVTAVITIMMAIGIEEQAVAEFGWVALLSLPGIVGGIGLLKRHLWARVLLIVFGAINLISFPPIGTALGIYTLVVLLRSETGRLFMVVSTSNGRGEL